MFGKRGQQLGIAIVGVVIFLGLIGILYQVDRAIAAARQQRMAIDDAAFAQHMQQCLEEGIAESANSLALQGGYAQLPAERAQLGANAIALFDTRIALPAEVVVQDALGRMVESQLPDCIDTFVDRQYQVDAGKPKVRIAFAQASIDAEVAYPITLTNGKNSKALSEWTATVPHGLPAALAAAREYASTPKPFIRLQPLVDAAGKHAVEVTLSDLGDGMVGYQFAAGETVLQFAVRYDGADTSFGSVVQLLPEQVNGLDIPVRATGVLNYGELGDVITVKKAQGNNPPIIPVYPTQRVVVGRTLLFPLKVTDPDGDKLTYEVLTPLPGLEITASGKLQWGPTEYQDTTIKFRVSDGKDSSEGSIHIIVDYRPKVDFEKLSYP